MSYNSGYVCSHCGEPAAYDGRCGDGPYLVCKCSKATQWVDDGRGGYSYNVLGAKPISVTEGPGPGGYRPGRS